MAKLMKSSKDFTIGIDLGGTKVHIALVDQNGTITAQVIRPTTPPDRPELNPKTASTASASEVRRHIQYVTAVIANSVDEVAAKLPKGKILRGIGLASAGPMNIDEGYLDHPSNFPGWKKVPLVDLLKTELKKRGLKNPIFFQNDAIAGALGEGWIGRARGLETYALITVGTGIGSGVILNGKPAQSKGMGSEWGHLIANTSGLQKKTNGFYEQTIEGLASGTGLIRRAHARGFKKGKVADLAQAAHDGDPLARELFDQAAEALAALFYNLSVGFHLECIVVSGGMLAVRDLYLPQANVLYRQLMRSGFPSFLCPVQVAKLGTKAGVIGAARLPRL
jgi:glucokinase